MAVFVYIAATDQGDFYLGLGKDLELEMQILRQTPKGPRGLLFLKLLYREWHETMREATAARKRIKRMRKKHKLALILEENPFLRDLMPEEVAAGPRQLFLFYSPEDEEPPDTGGFTADLPKWPRRPIPRAGACEQAWPEFEDWTLTILHS